jgi:hypothetical protein
MPHDKFSIGGAETDPVGGAAKFALLYLGAALAWLFVTDWLVLAFFEDTPRLQTIKGALFMAMSAVIVWAILYHNTRQWRKQNASLHRQVAFSRGLIEASPIPIVVLDADSRGRALEPYGSRRIWMGIRGGRRISAALLRR